jgi:hypothetical protein
MSRNVIGIKSTPAQNGGYLRGARRLCRHRP